MIIAINAPIGSGKDAVGQAIQYWTSTANEKWSFEKYLSIYNQLGTIGYGYLPEWEIRKFGFKLKQIASLVLGVPVEKFEDQEFKKSYLGPEWDIVWKTYFPNENSTETIQLTVREFLQKLGTEACRDQVNQNFWVNALMSDYTVGYDYSYDDKNIVIGYDKKNPIYPDWVITDLRFPNEFEAVKKREGICVKVNRPGVVKGTHPSETSLDEHAFDYCIDNSKGLEELALEVKEFLLHYKII